MERSPCVIRNPRKDRLRLPPRSHEDLYVLVKSRTTEIFRSACVGAAQIKKSLLALEPWAGRPGLSLLFCSRHEKDAQKEEVCPARRGSVESVCCIGRELYDLFPVLNKKKNRSVLRPSIV
ncbi:unnamed protein product [Lathyrus sativus]|nr:unnamed protein product [Lathyrus sativus]